MPDGKLHIKGTITIKSSKEEKEEKSKGKKGRKDKEFSMKYKKPRKRKGTGTGIAITGQSFGQTTAPYTPQAFMASMALRPQLTYSPEQFKTPQMQQPALEYAKFEQIPQLGYDVPVVTTRREFEEKAIPLIEENIQRGIKQKKKLLEADLRDAEQQAEERISQVSQEAEERVRDAEYAKQEATTKQQFYENELEQAQGNFIKEKADIALRVKQEKTFGELALVGEKAKARQEIQQAIREGKKAEIKKMPTADLKAYFKREDPSFLLGNPNTKEMREEVSRREGVLEERIRSKPPTQGDLDTFFRRPSVEKKEDPLIKQLEIEKKEEDEYMQRFLQKETKRPIISPSPLPDYQRTSSGIVTKKPTERDERFQMYAEDIRIKPFIVSEIGEIQQNKRYGLKDLGLGYTV